MIGFESEKFMKKTTNIFRDAFLFCLVFARLCHLCHAVYENSDTRNDITNNPAFGCDPPYGNHEIIYGWRESTHLAHTLNCTCRPDADELFIKENSLPGYNTYNLEINNCKRVRFGKNAIRNLFNCREIVLRDIASLTLDEGSMLWRKNAVQNPNELRDTYGMKILIENSHVENIGDNCFKGQYNEIVISNSKVESIGAYAFADLKYTESIILRNSEIVHFRMYPFKKFETDNLIIDNITTKELPSRAFYAITVNKNFFIKNSDIDIIRPYTFGITDPERFEIINNKIGLLDSEAFDVKVRGNVLFRNNHFNVINDGAFKRISVDKEEVFKDYSIIFDANTFLNLSRNALDFDLNSRVQNLNIREQCDCDKFHDRISHLSEHFSEINCLDRSGQSYISMQQYKTKKCTIITGHMSLIIILSVVFAACVVVGIAFAIYYQKVYKVKKYGDKKAKNVNNLSLIVPDGKTYRETELHVIVERADLLTTDL